MSFIETAFGNVPDTTVPGCICIKVPSENPHTLGDGFDGQRTLLAWNCPAHGWQLRAQPTRGLILNEWDESDARMYGWTQGE